MTETGNNRHLISTDGMNFREATPEELKLIELNEKEEQKKREEELKKDLPPHVKTYIDDLIKKLETRSIEDDEILESLEDFRKVYPYRNFGYFNFREASGYLEDTISNLKEIIKKD